MLKAAEVAVLVADSEATVVVVSGRHAGLLPEITGAAPSVQAAVVASEGQRPEPGRRRSRRVGVRSLAVPPLCALPSSRTSPRRGRRRPRQASAGFWLYTSGHDRTGRRAPSTATVTSRPCATPTARTVLGHRARRRVLLGAEALLRLRARQLPVLPAGVGASAVIDPDPPEPGPGRRAAPAATGRRCSSPHRASVRPWSTPPCPTDLLSSVRAVVTAGETLPGGVVPALHRPLRHRDARRDRLHRGPAHLLLQPPRATCARAGPGRPVAGYELRLLDERGAGDHRRRRVGRLVGAGRLGGRGLLAAARSSPPTRSSTAGCAPVTSTSDPPDGYYRFIGRNSDMIKAGGIWVSPAEVEGVLLEHEDVLEAAVVGGRNADGLEVTVAFVVPRQGRTVDPLPSTVTVGTAWPPTNDRVRSTSSATCPKTATGKIQRFALRARLDAAAAAAGTT